MFFFGFQWKGRGNLRSAEGTTSADALVNQCKANEIVRSPEIQKYLKRYEIPNIGYIEFTEAIAKYKVGRRLTEIKRPNYNKVRGIPIYVFSFKQLYLQISYKIKVD